MSSILLPNPLSGAVTGSFAYNTIKDRLPVIITRMIDTLCRDKDNIVEKYGKESYDEIKSVIGYLSQVKNEMQTNKPLKFFDKIEDGNKTNIHDDTGDWNNTLKKYESESEDGKVRWFVASWLFVECYMYKAIHYSLQRTSHFSLYDICEKEKWSTMEIAHDEIKKMEQYLMSVTNYKNLNDIKKAFSDILQISVWGNQSDLRISGGVPQTPEAMELNSSEENEEGYSQIIKTCSSNLLVNDSEKVYDHITNFSEGDRKTAIVLDNAGFELISDICLSVFMLRQKFASTITLYVKTRPWFVSDTLTKDLDIALNFLKASGFNNLFNEWSEIKASGQLLVKEHKFWTTCYPYPKMEEVSPDLYNELSQYKLIIFKGDLNYRKLVSDLDWPTATPFKTALNTFSNIGAILALRTIKGGPAVGLSGKIKQEAIENIGAEEWYSSGKCGMIQFSNS